MTPDQIIVMLSCIIAGLAGLAVIVIVANWRLSWKVVEAWLEWDIQWRAKMRAIDANICLRGLIRRLLPHVRQHRDELDAAMKYAVPLPKEEQPYRSAEIEALAKLIEESERECQR